MKGRHAEGIPKTMGNAYFQSLKTVAVFNFRDEIEKDATELYVKMKLVTFNICYYI